MVNWVYKKTSVTRVKAEPDVLPEPEPVAQERVIYDDPGGPCEIEAGSGTIIYEPPVIHKCQYPNINYRSGTIFKCNGCNKHYKLSKVRGYYPSWQPISSEEVVW